MCRGYTSNCLTWLVKAGDFDEFDALMARLEHLMGDRRYLRFAISFFNINCHPSWSAEEVYRFYREWYQRAVRPGLRAPKAHINPIDPAAAPAHRVCFTRLSPPCGRLFFRTLAGGT